MNFINFLSNSIIPLIVTLIVLYGIREKVKVFDCFVDGAKEGMEIVIGLLPTLIGLFVAIGLLRSSGVISFFIENLNPIIRHINFPKEIMPLALLRPISRKCIDCHWHRYYETVWGR